MYALLIALSIKWPRFCDFFIYLLMFDFAMYLSVPTTQLNVNSLLVLAIIDIVYFVNYRETLVNNVLCLLVYEFVCPYMR